MKLIFIFVFFIFSATPSKSNDECKFYVDTDKKIRCPGDSNYLLSYGYKYCSRFSELGSHKASSKELNTWISKTRICLQEMITENEKRHENRCDQLKEFAFDVHPICYKQYGVCSLGVLDLSKVAKVLVKNDFVTDFEQTKRASFMQMGNVLTSCLATSKTISSAGELFYNLYLKSRVHLASETASWALEIIDLAPDTLDAMESYFSNVISDMKTKENQQIKNEDVEEVTQNAIAGFDNRYNAVFDRESPKGMGTVKFTKMQKALNLALTETELKRGLNTARRLAANRK